MDENLDYMVRLNNALMTARHYGICQFRRILGHKSKNANRCGIVNVRAKKYKPPTKTELKKWDIEDKIDEIIQYVK